jgi:DnaJ-class molecular chaperone
MRDPYEVLGVGRTANEDDIKSAYRKLAKQFHPDLNPGKKDVEQKFKEVNAAYDILGDTEKRARYDRGEVDSEGHERARQSGSYQRYRGAGQQQPPEVDLNDFVGEDIFADLFGGMRGRGARYSTNWGFGEDPFASAKEKARGGNVQETLRVSFAEAALGAKKRLTLSTGKTIEINVPPGTESGAKLRLKGQGYEGTQRGKSGDAIIEIQVEAHPFFTRKGQDVLLDLPVTLYEAVLGAAVSVPTLDGHVDLKIPKSANSGMSLRLRGKGIGDAQGARGDQYVRLKIMLPEQPDDQITRLAEKIAKEKPYDPRKKAGII